MIHKFSKREAVILGRFYEILTMYLLNGLFSFKELINGYQKSFKSLLYKPDFVLKYDSFTIVVFITHWSLSTNSQNKFFETFNELVEFKLQEKNSRSFLFLFGYPQPWKWCINGFKRIFDKCVFLWDLESKYNSTLFSLFKKSLSNNLEITIKKFFKLVSSDSIKYALEKYKIRDLPNESKISKTVINKEKLRKREPPKVVRPISTTCYKSLLNSILNPSNSGEFASEKELNILRNMLNLRYPKLKEYVRPIENPKDLLVRIKFLRNATNNFTNIEKMRKYLFLCSNGYTIKGFKSNYNWVLDIFSGFCKLKSNRLMEEVNRIMLKKGKDRLFKTYSPINLTYKQCYYLTKIISKEINRSFSNEDCLNNILEIKRDHLRRHSDINPLALAIAYKLEQAGIIYKGYPKQKFVPINNLFSDLGKGLSAKIGVYFLIPTVDGKFMVIHGKSSTKDNYHRSGELAGRVRASRYLFKNNQVIENEKIKEWILVLDGNWKEKYIQRLYNSGIKAIFEPKKLQEEWPLIRYLKKKGALTKK